MKPEILLAVSAFQGIYSDQLPDAPGGWPRSQRVRIQAGRHFVASWQHAPGHLRWWWNEPNETLRAARPVVFSVLLILYDNVQRLVDGVGRTRRLSCGGGRNGEYMQHFPQNTRLSTAPNLIRHPLNAPLSVEPKCGGGLLLLRHVTPLSRRNVVYFHSGAHTSVQVRMGTSQKPQFNVPLNPKIRVHMNSGYLDAA
jgi:hypothetical protein